MERLALVVEYETHPQLEAKFERAIRAHANACLTEEEGCLRFEVLQSLNDNGIPLPNKFMANEVFKDEAALAFHRNTA